MVTYDSSLKTIHDLTGKTETDVLSDFLESNADNKKYHGDEGAMRALESEDFADYVVQEAFNAEMNENLD